VYNNRRQSEGAQRAAERRKREDESNRLSAEVPKLQSLALQISEVSQGGPVAEPTYVRRVVVANAPALFFIPCGNPHCKDGGHDVTHVVMRALRAGETSFDGQDGCDGSVGSSACARTLRFIATATYA